MRWLLGHHDVIAAHLVGTLSTVLTQVLEIATQQYEFSPFHIVFAFCVYTVEKKWVLLANDCRPTWILKWQRRLYKYLATSWQMNSAQISTKAQCRFTARCADAAGVSLISGENKTFAWVTCAAVFRKNGCTERCLTKEYGVEDCASPPQISRSLRPL